MFDRQSLYITALGELGTGGWAGEDIFSFGIRATGADDFNAIEALDELDVPGVAAIVGTYFEAASTCLSTRAHLYTVKVAALSVTGEYLTAAKEAEPEPGGVSGALTTPKYPNQIAWCVSLGTVTTLGRAVRGRYYLPGAVPTIGVDGRVGVSERNNAVVGTQTYLNALNTKLAADITQTCVLQIMSDIGAGMSRVITTVRIGDVLDTIRSRRNALTEAYHQLPVAYT